MYTLDANEIVYYLKDDTDAVAVLRGVFAQDAPIYVSAGVLKTQKQNFEWFGWKTPEALSFNWQYTKDADEESSESCCDAVAEFAVLLQLALPR